DVDVPGRLAASPRQQRDGDGEVRGLVLLQLDGVDDVEVTLSALVDRPQLQDDGLLVGVVERDEARLAALRLGWDTPVGRDEVVIDDRVVALLTLVDLAGRFGLDRGLLLDHRGRFGVHLGLGSRHLGRLRLEAGLGVGHRLFGRRRLLGDLVDVRRAGGLDVDLLRWAGGLGALDLVRRDDGRVVDLLGRSQGQGCGDERDSGDAAEAYPLETLHDAPSVPASWQSWSGEWAWYRR